MLELVLVLEQVMVLELVLEMVLVQGKVASSVVAARICAINITKLYSLITFNPSSASFFCFSWMFLRRYAS